MSERNEGAAVSHDELMRYIDGELPSDRARAVAAEIERDSELRRDYVIFDRMKSDLRDMGDAMVANGAVWETVNRRLTRPMGWVLFVIGVAVWSAYGTYSYLAGADALWQKLATSAVAVGLGMLLISALVDRWRDLKTDPYKEIER